MLYLLNYHPEHHEGHLKDNVYTFCLIKLLIHNLSKIWTSFFSPMVHRCKKCGDISKVTSGRRAEIENVKYDRPSDLHFHLRQQMLLLKCDCIFSMYGGLGKKAFFWILKRWFISRITSQNVQRLQNSANLASFLWGNLKSCQAKFFPLCTETTECIKKLARWPTGHKLRF